MLSRSRHFVWILANNIDLISFYCGFVCIDQSGCPIDVMWDGNWPRPHRAKLTQPQKWALIIACDRLGNVYSLPSNSQSLVMTSHFSFLDPSHIHWATKLYKIKNLANQKLISQILIKKKILKKMSPLIMSLLQFSDTCRQQHQNNTSNTCSSSIITEETWSRNLKNRVDNKG